MLDLKNTSVKARNTGENIQIDKMLENSGIFWKPLVVDNKEYPVEASKRQHP
jgi:hypothetical protein